jgi:hypothetical protein
VLLLRQRWAKAAINLVKGYSSLFSVAWDSLVCSGALHRPVIGDKWEAYLTYLSTDVYRDDDTVEGSVEGCVLVSLFVWEFQDTKLTPFAVKRPDALLTDLG